MKMCRTGPQASPFLLVVMVLECFCLTAAYAHVCQHQEAMLTIALNQQILLKEMNVSAVNQQTLLKEMNASSVCASRERELEELRLMKEEILEVRREVREVLKAVRNASLPQPSHQPSLQDFQNDTIPSLCARNKVLYGARGFLSPSFPRDYQDNVYCEWRVILPNGTRPVFTWHFIDIESQSNCVYDWVTVFASGTGDTPKICGSAIPTSHPMHNMTTNEFSVVFISDGSNTGKGFLLQYAAELAA